MKTYLYSIGARLFVLIFGVMILYSALFTSFSLRESSASWMRSIERSADRTSATIALGLRHAMLDNCKTDVQDTIKNIAMQPGIEVLRIYDKDGLIIFSSNEDEVYNRVDMESEKCLICHTSNEPLKAVPQDERSRVFRRADGTLTLGQILPISNAPECSTADCHAHPPDQQVLGVLDLIMPVDFVEESRQETERATMIMATILALVGGILIAIFIHFFVRRPVKQMISGTRKITAGELNMQLSIHSNNELGELAQSFNRMTASLNRAKQQNERWEQTLEKRIDEKTNDLKKAQEHLVHLEKMASMGKLAATVAHEINNPLAGILIYAKLVARELKDLVPDTEAKQELNRYLDVIYHETERCGGIVKNLLSFARGSEGDPVEQNFFPILEKTLMIVNHHFELGNIEVDVQRSDSDELYCDKNQLEQALIALFVNAVEAMPDGGNLNISTRQTSSFLEVDIKDTGVGIPAETLPHIFEPFVSTKGAAKGVGLGLAVVYGIAHQYGGRIEVTSEVGKGTTFTLYLPRKAPSQ